MSILDTFNQLREEKQSLETLASLPQTLIMNMVQRKEIPQEDLPMIMAKKAEMAQTNANMKAAQAQQQQGPAGTIMEQLLAKNAAEEAARSQPAPQELTDVGIASNPVPEMRMAGGGIVAFSGTDGSYVSGKSWNEMTQEEKDAYIASNPALQRSMGISQGIKNFFAPLAEGKNWDPIRKTHEIVNDVVMKPWQRFISEPANIQADKFRGDKPYSYQATPEDKAKAKEVAILKEIKDKGLQTADQPGDYDMYDPKKVVRPAAPAANPNAPAAANPAKPSIQEEQKGIFDEYKKLFEEDKEAAAAARNEAKWQRIMEAGLNMMGGESPYAFTNIGKGAATAARGYAEDVKGFRAEDRERKKQLAALGIKEKEMGLEGRKLDITAKHYDDWFKAKSAELGELKGQRVDSKIADMAKGLYATDVNAYKNQIGRELNDEELNKLFANAYNRAQMILGSGSGKGTGVQVPTTNVLGYDPATRTFK